MTPLKTRLGIYTLSLVTFSAGVTTYVHAGMLAPLVADLGITLGQGGLVATLYGLTFAIAAPVIARMTTLMERRRLLLIGLAGMVGSSVLCVFAPTFTALLAARMAAALGAAIAMPLASGMAATMVEPDRRGKALATVVLGMTSAFIVGVPLGTVVGDLFGWRATFAFAAACGLAALLASSLTLPRSQPSPGPTVSAFALLRKRQVRTALFSTLLSLVAIFTVVAFVGPVVTTITGRSGAAIGLFQFCIGLGSLGGVALGGRLVGKRAERAAAACAFALIAATQGVFSALLMAAPSPSPALDLTVGGLLFASAFALFGLMPMMQARLIAAATTAATLALALNGSTNFLGQALGAAIAAVAIDTVGLSWVGILGCAAALAGLGLHIGKRSAPDA